jgi:putative membrane protein
MMGGYGFDGGFGGGSWIGMGLMMVFMVLVVVGGIMLVVWLVRAMAAPYGGYAQGPYQQPYSPRPDDALETARRRYASGEITKDEFEEIKRTLGG